MKGHSVPLINFRKRKIFVIVTPVSTGFWKIDLHAQFLTTVATETDMLVWPMENWWFARPRSSPHLMLYSTVKYHGEGICSGVESGTFNNEPSETYCSFEACVCNMPIQMGTELSFNNDKISYRLFL